MNNKSLKLIKVDLKYKKYVDTSSKDAITTALDIEKNRCGKYDKVLDKLRCLTEWVDIPRLRRRAQHYLLHTPPPLNIIRSKGGLCLEVACTLCTIVRIWGFRAYVVVLSLKTATRFEDSIHAFTLVEVKDNNQQYYVILDPLSDRKFLIIHHLEDILEWGIPICIFNDNESYIVYIENVDNERVSN